jgi:hypothetical protein
MNKIEIDETTLAQLQKVSLELSCLVERVARYQACESCGTKEEVGLELTGSLGRVTPLCKTCSDRLGKAALKWHEEQMKNWERKDELARRRYPVAYFFRKAFGSIFKKKEKNDAQK